MKQVTFRIDDEKWKMFRIALMKSGVTVREFLLGAVDSLLKGSKK